MHALKTSRAINLNPLGLSGKINTITKHCIGYGLSNVKLLTLTIRKLSYSLGIELNYLILV